MGTALAGRRILITRAQHQASQLAALLQAAGAETISIPTIEIMPPDDCAQIDAALSQLHAFDWLVITSANTMQILQQRMQILDVSVEKFSHLKIGVVGPATARAVEEMGLKVALVPQEAVAESLAIAMQPLVSGKKIFLPQAQGARDVLLVQLQQAGAVVTAVEAYRNVVPEGSIERLREVFSQPESGPHAIAFTSSSTAQHFFQLLERSGAVMPQEIALASIGPVTSKTLQQMGFTADIEAVEHTIPGLVDALEKYFAQQ